MLAGNWLIFHHLVRQSLLEKLLVDCFVIRITYNFNIRVSVSVFFALIHSVIFSMPFSAFFSFNPQLVLYVS